MEKKEINIKIFNDSNIFLEDKHIDYINNLDIIINKNNNLKLDYEMIKFDNILNYNNYDFSDRFINIKVIMSLLEFFNLIAFNTYEIYDFFNVNKEKYNIWKYLYNSEYICCQTPSKYDKNIILRICLSYSWKECLYDLLKKCLNINRCYKTFIWIDIFCVNQFNDRIKSKGLNNIDYVYHIADFYNISSLIAFKRYWCCYEMSLKKKSIDGIIINHDNDLKINIANILNKLYNNIFRDIDLLYNKDCKEHLHKYILEFQKIKEFEENKFSLENAEITFDNDKKFIEERIKNKYGTLQEYEKRMNIYIYLIKYRDDINYVYLANRIMEL